MEGQTRHDMTKITVDFRNFEEERKDIKVPYIYNFNRSSPAPHNTHRCTRSCLYSDTSSRSKMPVRNVLHKHIQRAIPF
jgi:hypothetical protein